MFFLHNLFDAAQKGFREATMKPCLWIGFNGIYWELFVLLEWVVMFRPNFFFLTLFLSCLCVSLKHGGDFFFIIILTSGSTFHNQGSSAPS